MKTVSAKLNIEVTVDCPECDHPINLLDQRDTDNFDHNDCGEILQQACPSHNISWSGAHKYFEVEDVTCTKCKTEFNVKELEW